MRIPNKMKIHVGKSHWYNHFNWFFMPRLSCCVLCVCCIIIIIIAAAKLHFTKNPTKWKHSLVHSVFLFVCRSHSSAWTTQTKQIKRITQQINCMKISLPYNVTNLYILKSSWFVCFSFFSDSAVGWVSVLPLCRYVCSWLVVVGGSITSQQLGEKNCF